MYKNRKRENNGKKNYIDTKHFQLLCIKNLLPSRGCAEYIICDVYLYHDVTMVIFGGEVR